MAIQVAHFLGTMRPGHDGVTRFMYRMRAEFLAGETKNRHYFLSPIVPQEEDPEIVKLPSLPFPLSTDYRLSIASVSRIERAVAPWSIGLVHVHSPCTLGRAAVKYAKKNHLPLVATYHTHFPTYLKYYKVEFLKDWVIQNLVSFYSQFDTVIAPTQTVLEDLRSYGLRNGVYIPHGVNTENFSPRYRSDQWREQVGGAQKTVVTFVGRLVWEKNLVLLAEAAKLLKLKDQVQWVIVGDGPARAQLQKMMPEAHFTGNLGDRDLQVAYASSDLFVFPSVTETFGNVTVEAMASGLPAIGAASGGSCDLIQHERTGLLTRPNDAEDFAKAVDRLTQDSSLRQDLSAQALKSIEFYQWKNSARSYEQVYEALSLRARTRCLEGQGIPSEVMFDASNGAPKAI